MPICNALTGGLDKSCSNNSGGVNKLWVSNWAPSTIALTNGEITTFTPQAALYAVTTVGSVITSVVAGMVQLVSVTVPGDVTAQFTAGSFFKFTYIGQFGPGSWSGDVASSSYNAGTNTTTILPDFQGFVPVIGAVGTVPSNSGNSTVSNFLFHEIKTNKNVCSFTETAAIDLIAGTTYFNQAVNMVLNRRETVKRTFIEKLVAGQQELFVLVLDSNGIYWLFGLNEGAYVSSVEGGSGTSKADASGYTVIFSAMEPMQAYEVDPAAIGKYLI